MSIKIQINSLEAVERLIGGDNEIEIQVRNSIVNDFTKRHLKGVVSEKMSKDISKAIENELLKEVKLGYGFSFELNEKTPQN